jgi:hypothetical protein
MRYLPLVVLLSLTFGTTSAQEVAPADIQLETACDEISSLKDCYRECRPAARWVQAEYLMGWLTDGPNPIPLVVTTPDPNQPLVIGQNGTSILFGSQDIDYGMLQGGRATIGKWINSECDLGIEASGFLMGENGFHDSFFSAPTNNSSGPSSPSPPSSPTQIQAPFFPPSPPVGNSPPTMSILTDSNSRLWGTEVNGLSRRYRSSALTIDTLFGMRHLNLRERISVSANLSQPIGNDVAITEGADHFGTASEFYGAQLGARLSRNLNRWRISATSKIAMGFNANEVLITGYQTYTDPGMPPATTPGFNYTQPTNIGRTKHYDFGIAPELQFATGYQLTNRWSLLAGYNVLFWHNVVRPGDQVDSVINTSQQAGGTLVGDPRPTPLFNRSDLWFHAITFGTEYRF